tara:strand:- start:1752 stop:2525 length:774 start_codon:yes stop_codon:yes gene_type:complete
MIYEHNLNPVAVEIFFLKIHWYSLAYVFGFIFCNYYSKYLIKKKLLNLELSLVDDFITWLIIAVILGGRLGYVIFYNFDFYFENPVEVFKIWQGGMSFHGALLGLIILIIFYSKIKNVKFSELCNLVAYSSPIGIFLGRLANFINAELVGRPTDGSWGILYESEFLTRHPSQIYEAVFEGLIIFIILNFFVRSDLKNRLNGYALFLIFYSFFRFNLEFFREPDSHLGFIINNITMGQILTFPMLLIGIIFLKNEKKL